MKLRGLLYRRLFKNNPINLNILESVIINNPENISLGERVSIHQFTYFDAQGEIEIGNNVAIGNHVKLITSDHVFDKSDVPIKDQGIETNKITIKDNVWIGAGATILKGVVIGENSIIGAQSLVNKNIPPNVIAVGVPCKVIKERNK
tara:strand:- start:4795 stop:5235 length:441 start_codon:yes stop_codon:yes gene_type:complete